MKQKLLNSFTWRGTLLVALLSCAFSAWGQEKKEIVFNAQSSPWGLSTNDNITWTTNTDGAHQFDDNFGIGGGGTGKNDRASYVKLSTSDVLGTITKIVVTASRSENDPTISVTVGENTFGNDQVVNSSSNNAYTFSGTAYCENNELLINIHRSSRVKGTIYVKSVTVTYIPKASIPIRSTCYDKDETDKKIYGTYSNQKAFVVPSDLTVAKVNVKSGTLEVTPYITGAIVPANTGVMVSCKSEVDVNKSIFLDPSTTAPDTQKNMLRPTGSGISANDMAENGFKFYYLTMNGDQIGFYRRNDTGSAFEMNVANKAYLAVPSDQVVSIKDFSFNDIVDGIKAIETTETESKVIYNLAGQRVSKMQKGIYVVNGKKVLVK